MRFASDPVTLGAGSVLRVLLKRNSRGRAGCQRRFMETSRKMGAARSFLIDQGAQGRTLCASEQGSVETRRGSDIPPAMGSLERPLWRSERFERSAGIHHLGARRFDASRAWLSATPQGPGRATVTSFIATGNTVRLGVPELDLPLTRRQFAPVADRVEDVAGQIRVVVIRTRMRIDGPPPGPVARFRAFERRQTRLP